MEKKIRPWPKTLTFEFPFITYIFIQKLKEAKTWKLKLIPVFTDNRGKHMFDVIISSIIISNICNKYHVFKVIYFDVI